MKKYIPLIAAAICLVPLFFNWGCANTTQAPSGGLKDTIPPVIVDISPLPGTTMVPTKGARIVFTFNEYVTIKTASNIFLSPPQEKMPKSRMVDKKLIVTFEDELAPETTYVLSLDNAIADNNEGNLFAGFSYVFSTGEKIDSMMITGTVRDCDKLLPVKGATVMLYKDHADSAVFLQRPYAAVRTDDWGFFAIPYIQDTMYRLYALKEETQNNKFDPESDLIAFSDSLVRPVTQVNDTIKELLKYDMTDTLACLERNSEYQLTLFKEKPSRQSLANRVRVADRSAYITFTAPNAYIDSLWIPGYPSKNIISQFNDRLDSLEIWLNDRKPSPDTLHLFVNYRKTDTLGRLVPQFEHLRLTLEKGKKTIAKTPKRELAKEDTTCMLTLEAKPETVEQYGYKLEFKLPVIKGRFDDVQYRMISPKQKETNGKLIFERDSTNLRVYNIRPESKFLPGYEYIMKIPYGIFTDINGSLNDSTEVKISLPKDDKLSTLKLNVQNVPGKIIVELMNERKSETLRSYIIDSDSVLNFPYLAEGNYSIRITDDSNRNGMVDTGNLLEHRQPEKVRFYLLDGKESISIPESAEVEQNIDIMEVLK